MESALLTIHSILRWFFLIAILYAIVLSIKGIRSKGTYTPGDKRIALVTLIFAHLQLILGFVLYFLNGSVEAFWSAPGEGMKDSYLRYWAIEHMSMMLIGIILITLGYSLAKRAANDMAKFKKQLIFFVLGLVLILSRIPFPFTEISRPWIRF